MATRSQSHIMSIDTQQQRKGKNKKAKTLESYWKQENRGPQKQEKKKKNLGNMQCL